MRNALRTAFVVAIVAGQSASAQDFSALPTTSSLESKDAIRLGISVDKLYKLKVIQKSAQDRLKSADETRLYSIDESGGIISSRYPALKEEVILLSPGLVSRLRKDIPFNLVRLLEIGEEKGPARSLLDAVKSVPPGALPPIGSLPELARREASLNGWTKPDAATSDCAAEQRDFLRMAEPTLHNGQAYDGRQNAERSELIKVVKAYEAACLISVSPPRPESPSSALPLERLAVLLNGAGVPLCMALHLGEDRFLTAKHCFFTDGGQPRPEMTGASLAMADSSLPRPVPIEIVPSASQPYGAGGSPVISAQDLLLVRAPLLSSTVKARKFSIRYATATTVAEVALVIGIYPFAEPEKSIPAVVGAKGEGPLWTNALRMTRDNGTTYCRVWDRSKRADGGGCIEHSCQTLPGFSGAPVFVRATGPNGLGEWLVAGINVSGALDKSSCGAFANKPSAGLLGSIGAVATVIPASITGQALAYAAR